MKIKTISTHIFRDHRFWVGLLANVQSTVQVHPYWRLLVDWVPSTQADKKGGGRSGRRGQAAAPYGPSRVHLYNTLISLHSTLDITVHFDGSNGTAYIRPLPSDISTVCPKDKTEQYPMYFLSLEVAPQPIFSLFGDFMTIFNFQTLIIIFGNCVLFRNTYRFLDRKK